MGEDYDYGPDAARVFHELWLQGAITPAKIEQATATNDKLVDGTIENLIVAFENAAIVEADSKYWTARDLQKLLGYSDWGQFLDVVEKAKEACRSIGQNVADHFSTVGETISEPTGSYEISNIRLSRYACYLIAQNGDPRKTPIAFAQTYFAIQARRQELRDQDESQSLPLSDDQKRLLLREDIKGHNKKLASVAKAAGVATSIDFAVFQNAGYTGLYGGLDRTGIARRKGLKKTQNILDHMGSTELAANLFRATQTEEKLQRDNVRGKEAANAVHNEIGRQVRKTIHEIGGTMPEALPVAEDIVKVARRIKKAISSSGALPPD